MLKSGRVVLQLLHFFFEAQTGGAKRLGPLWPWKAKNSLFIAEFVQAATVDLVCEIPHQYGREV